jgi:AcrR family transcriptional regulator
MAQAAQKRAPTKSLISSPERIRETAKRLFAERGYEGTSTAEICRLAGTSQSQLVKHFRDKQGLLDAVFQHAWEQINPTVRLATEAVEAPREKLRLLTEMVLNFLLKDRELCTILLLEGRRMRGDGHMVVLVPGYLEFVKLLDEILEDMAEHGELRAEISPAAIRSGLIGAFEGLLRDQLLSRTSKFPASYTDSDIRAVFYAFLSACLSRAQAI